MSYGPIDFIVLELDSDKLTGEIMDELLNLVEAKIVRVVDLVVVHKDQYGNHQTLEIEELTPDVFKVFDPEDLGISGIVQVEDIAGIAKALENNKTAAVLVVENLWAIKFGEAVVRANGRLLMHERIPFDVVNETLAAFSKADEGI